MRTSTLATVSNEQIIALESLQEVLTEVSYLEKIYIISEINSELSRAVEKMELRLKESYENAIKTNDVRRKIFYSNLLKSFEGLREIDSFEFVNDLAFKKTVVKKYKSFSIELDRAFDQFWVDGDSIRVSETDRLRDYLKTIGKHAQISTMEI